MGKIVLALLTLFLFQLSMAQEQEVQILRAACIEISIDTREPIGNTLIVDQIYDPMRESGSASIPSLADFFDESPRTERLPFESRGQLKILRGTPEELTNEGYDQFVESGEGSVELELEGSFNRTHRLLYEFRNTAERVRIIFDRLDLGRIKMWTGDFPNESLRGFSCLPPYQATKSIPLAGDLQSEQTNMTENQTVN